MKLAFGLLQLSAASHFRAGGLQVKIERDNLTFKDITLVAFEFMRYSSTEPPAIRQNMRSLATWAGNGVTLATAVDVIRAISIIKCHRTKWALKQ